jgi:transposase-like protein
VNAFLDRPLDGEWPYLWLDATYLKVREGGRIVSVAAIIAVAVNTDGRREIVGLHIGPSEAKPFWASFLRSLVKRGLSGTRLVISGTARLGPRRVVRRRVSAARAASSSRAGVHRGGLRCSPILRQDLAVSKLLSGSPGRVA